MANEEPSKLLLVVLLILGTLFTLLHILYGARNALHETYVNEIRWYNSRAPCKMALDTKEDMTTLLSNTFKILQNVGAEPTVCFGTLWGALRNGDYLPWDPRVDICIMASDISNTSFKDLQKQFSNMNVSLSNYDWWRGNFEVKYGKTSGTINVFCDCTLFYHLTHPEHAVKLEHNSPIEPYACSYSISSILLSGMTNVYRPFPSWLLTGPFSTKQLAGKPVSVPHDNFEMQKYIYPNDWWLEKKPLGC